MANSESGDSVVDRLVRLLSAFPEGTGSLQLSQLAARADLPLTTTHRLVKQLAEHGLLEAGPGGAVRPGVRLWELVNRTSPTLELRQSAIPFMEDIQQVLNQNIDVEFMSKLFNGVHTYNATEADAWIAWLEAQHRKWADYLDATIERSAAFSTRY